jgi:hypothetical protein
VQAVIKRWSFRPMPKFFAVLILSAIVVIILPTYAYAVGDDITISGPGLNNPEGITITQDQLRGLEPVRDDYCLEQHDVVYSTINTWPTKWWYRGEGVSLTDLFALAGGLNANATQVRFTSRDNFRTTFSLQELLYEPRYRFPNFMDTGLPGHLIGDASGRELVPTIIAHQSFSLQDYEDINKREYFNRDDANLLLFGQRTVTQQTNSRFAKYVRKIEVLTDPVPQWDVPTASVEPGEVLAGTLVKLESENNDEDKVHYTLDGSDPTIESPMYNWVASRWWDTRKMSDEDNDGISDLDEINQPITIRDNTIIKAIVSGPGRADSEIATFEYRILSFTISKEDPPEAIKDQEYPGYTFTCVAGEEPYTFDITDGSLPEGMVLDGAELKGKPTESGTFTFTVTARDSSDPANEDSHDYQITVYNPSPALTPDTTDNTVGKTIELTFVDDQAWREAITDIQVNSASIQGKYSVDDGVITINGDVFQSVGNYTIDVIARGYLVAQALQVITGDVQTPPEEEPVVLTIKGEGVTRIKEYTQRQLELMDQHQELYSSINTWPSKKWYVGRGVLLSDLLNSAGLKGNAQQIRFYANDGYYMTLTVQELLRDNRYCFPNFKNGNDDADGHIPGSSSGARKVETILALIGAEDSDPDYMSDKDALLLMLGQRTVTEQTGPLFVKNINRIEVLTDSPERWDEPTAEPGGGTVRKGTKVVLHGPGDDMDKVHYTTDGTTPNINSPMYNLVAKRWWSARGAETVAEINQPIVINQDTTIKAITIGPGKTNSRVVEFVYKVIESEPTTTDKITPHEGGKISLQDEATIDLPAGALSGSNPVEVRIDRVSEPPDIPSGVRFLGSVFDFSVDGKTSYSFNKPVTLKFTFDPEEVGPDEIVAVYYFDRAKEQWVNLGGVISDNTITVQVDHFTMFAVMAKEKPIAVGTIKPGEGGTVKLGNQAAIEIPAGAMSGIKSVKVRIEQDSDPPGVPAGLTLLGDVYQFSVDSNTNYSFKKPVTITLWFDSSLVGHNMTPVIYYYDQAEEQWIKVGQEVSGNTIKAQVRHSGQFAVMAEALRSPLTDISGHWAESKIRELVGRGAVSGYPDGTFKPDNNITRGEFVTVVVKVLELQPRSGPIFVDSAGHWAKDSIATAAYYGIVNGYSASTFGPDDYITREQMALMIVRALQINPASYAPPFTDSHLISSWAREAVATAAEKGIVNGYPDGTMRPLANATRAEAVTMVGNALKANIRS